MVRDRGRFRWSMASWQVMITGYPAHVPWWDVSGSGGPELTCAALRGLHLMQDARSPAEVLEVPHGLLSRTRESDAGQLAQAVGASLDHLRRWLSWAAEEAADVQAQRRRCREAEAHWADGSEYAYVLRPGQSGVAMPPRARGL